MPTTPYDSHMENYYYGSQLRSYITQFMAIFSGLKVKVGKNDVDDTGFIEVPIHYAIKDRVVGANLSENTQNKPLVLPQLTANLISYQYSMKDHREPSIVDRKTVFPRGGVFPDSLKVLYQPIPSPYMIGMTLDILTSNSDQMFQILEQIGMVFAPTLQIQTSDGPYDNTKITSVELTSIQVLDNDPIGTDEGIHNTKMEFEFLAWLTPPNNFRDNVIKKIRLRVDIAHGSQTVDELVQDVGRALPPYDTIIDAAKIGFPKQ